MRHFDDFEKRFAEKQQRMEKQSERFFGVLESAIASVGMAQNQPISPETWDAAQEEIARLSARVRELEAENGELFQAFGRSKDDIAGRDAIIEKLLAKVVAGEQPAEPLYLPQPAISGDGADSQGTETGEGG